jgi:tRNA threonylcarbamoyladenosine biosynthesis protein TsaB
MGIRTGLAMKILAIETSTEACSVAVWVAGEVRERHEIAPRRHTDLVLPWCDQLLAEAGITRRQLDAIAVGRGPGAFTGVRLAVALVQGMALALDKPVLPVSTLAALALQAPSIETGAAGDQAPTILSAIDARMGELYLGLFRHDPEDMVVAVSDEWMATPAEPRVADELHNLQGVGSGFAAAGQALVAALGPRLRLCDALALPHAGDIARLGARMLARGQGIRADLLEPAYLRDKVALTLEEQATARSLR